MDTVHYGLAKGVCRSYLSFLYYLHFVMFGTHTGYTMGTNCAPNVADLFLFSMNETSPCVFRRINKLKLLKPRYL